MFPFILSVGKSWKNVKIKFKAPCYKVIDSWYFVPFRFSSAVVCPKLTVPDNGGVVPSSCSQTNVEYGTRCVFYCNDGYELSGPRYTGCQDDTSWSEISSLSCVRGQFSRTCYCFYAVITERIQYLVPLSKLIYLNRFWLCIVIIYVGNVM